MNTPSRAPRPELGGTASAIEVPLRAGPLRMIFDHGDLRYIKFGDNEVIRRIYAAVRDQFWATIPGVLSNLHVDSGHDFFHISYDSEHSQGEISFVWHCEIHGEPGGTIQFSFEGEARSTFLKNRIGLCVLHPVAECAGQPCKIIRVDGTRLESRFPRLVAQEQPVKDLNDLSLLSYKISPDAWVIISFEGDLFETEDQRNWTDASFKTYSTPQHLPYPVEIQRGSRIQQTITLKLGGDPVEAPPITTDERPPITLNIDRSKFLALPLLGLGVSSFLEPYSDRAIRRLKALHLSHLRVDLNPASPNLSARIAHATWEARALGVPLEVALTVRAQEPGLQPICDWVAKNPGLIKHWIVFSENAKSTTAATLSAVRSELRGLGPIGVGTNSDFYQLNQFRPPWQEADFVCWSMNPQVHAFDDLSLAETPEAIPDQIESARAYFPGKPLYVSPVTLKPRFNPGVTAATPAARNQLPREVDPRQTSLFGAAWTLATFQHLAAAATDSVTFFETVGWRGVLERDLGAPVPEKFASAPGGVFPLYLILRWIYELPKACLVTAKLSQPHKLAVLSLLSGRVLRLIVANLTNHNQRLALNLPQAAPGSHSAPLDRHSQLWAMQQPEEFLATRHPISKSQPLLSIGLAALEISCVDFELHEPG